MSFSSYFGVAANDLEIECRCHQVDADDLPAPTCQEQDQFFGQLSIGVKAHRTAVPENKPLPVVTSTTGVTSAKRKKRPPDEDDDNDMLEVDVVTCDATDGHAPATNVEYKVVPQPAKLQRRRPPQVVQCPTEYLQGIMEMKDFVCGPFVLLHQSQDPAGRITAAILPSDEQDPHRDFLERLDRAVRRKSSIDMAKDPPQPNTLLAVRLETSGKFVPALALEDGRALLLSRAHMVDLVDLASRDRKGIRAFPNTDPTIEEPGALPIFAILPDAFSDRDGDAFMEGRFGPICDALGFRNFIVEQQYSR